MKEFRFFELPLLVDRLRTSATRGGRTVVFLVGAPLSSPELPGERGVPGVDQMIALVRAELGLRSAVEVNFDEELRGASNKYQTAFELLNACRGQDAVNDVVRRAVLSARQVDGRHAMDGKTPLDPHLLERLDEDTEGWVLPLGVRTLGKIVTAHPDAFGRVVLTSNFDPLIEVSIRRHAGRYLRTVLHRDGDLAQSSGDGCHVVHFHGFWIGRDTLHTPWQLSQERPRLKHSLATLLGRSTVVVLGYGGWDDILTKALLDVVTDDDATPDIIWTFHESDGAVIAERKQEILSLLEPGISRGRVSLFKGIDCNTFLPRLSEELLDERSRRSISLTEDLSTRLVEVTDATSNAAHFELRITLPNKTEHDGQTDSPPQVDDWVGRAHELNLLNAPGTSVAVITGIGGQGKSALAAHYLNGSREEGHFEEWDWRDCKEQGDTISTHLIRIISRLGEGRIDPSTLETVDVVALVEILFRFLGARKWLFVFDNVDHYVDLVTGQFVAGAAKLFDAAASRSHRSKFIFTCRPKIQSESSAVLLLPLSGLSEAESVELFRKHGVEDGSLVRAAHTLTEGHPLWINMIATQVVRMQRSLAEVIADIERGKGDLPEKTLRSIWGTLNENQKTLLRTLGELERAETEERLLEMVGSLPWNRFAKALRVLKSLHLVVIKSQPGQAEHLELHPLVRSFIRSEFPRQDRDRFITPIIVFLDRMIGKYKSMLDKEPSFAVLDHWSQKAELEINRGRHQEAVNTLIEVSGPLLSRGFSEELIRVGKKLFSELDWTEACSSLRGFDQLLRRLIESMTQMGQFREARHYLSRYADSIPGKSVQFINYCDLNCYLHWYQEEYATAIFWGEQGESLRAASKVDTQFNTAHNLALARRDMGQPEVALQFFLGGQTLEQVLDGEVDRARRGSYYGNIGRCLQLQGKLKEAIRVYRMSALILEDEQNESAILNRGYIRLWIGECLRDLEDIAGAAAFFRSAISKWFVVSPPRAQRAEKMLAALVTAASVGFDPYSGDELTVERIVREWIRKGRLVLTETEQSGP